MNANLHSNGMYVPQEAESALLRDRISLRNVLGLCRYLYLRIRFQRLKVGLFFVDRGADIDVGPRTKLQFGRRVRFMRDFSGHFYGTVSIGDDVFFNRGCNVVTHNSLTIGNHCLFGEMVSIHDDNHVVKNDGRSIASRGMITAPVVIGNNVWVGAKATILPGVHIGDNAVIGANAVVTRDVPEDTIVAGVPAHVIRGI